MKHICLALILGAPAAATAGKLVATKWSGDINVSDPVACSVDEQGRVYVTETTRRKAGDLDIREHMEWVANDQSFQDIDDKMKFYHEALAPGKLKGPSGGLLDHNKDGSVDWQDLLVPKERIWRLEDKNGDGIADEKKLFAEGFNTEVSGIAAGVLWHEGSVYVTVAPDLWKLEDFDGDGKSDLANSIAHGFGHHIAYAGHDMHGLTVGPDGRIYWTIGDKGVNVKMKDGSRIAQPNQGCVLRCEPDGSGFEIFAQGLRNVQEIAFDEFGNLFGVDNDADKPGEKERFVYITEQSDSGWRCGYQYMKDFCPWVDEGRWKPHFKGQPAFITPPVASSHDGPAGFVYNPGTALGPEWKNCFFLDQFPSGKMNAIRISNEGASFKIDSDVEVSSGIMGIGMSWGPDGKLYFADWIGGYPLDGKGALWTLDDPSSTGSAERKEVQELLKAGFAKRAVPELLTLLAHADVRIRRGAQFALAAKKAWPEFQTIAVDDKAPLLARVHAIWGLGQGARMEKGTGTIGESAETIVELLKSSEVEILAQTLRVASEAKLSSTATPLIAKLLSHENDRIKMLSGIALGRLKSDATAATALMAAASTLTENQTFLRHGLVTGLAGCATSEDLAAHATNPATSQRLVSLLALSRQRSPLCAAFLEDKEPQIVQEAARAIYDDVSILDALPKVAELTGRPTDFVTSMRALNAALRVGRPEDAARLVSFALIEGDKKLRKEALTLISLWPTPPVLDRADGVYREIKGHTAEQMAMALAGKSKDLLAIKDADLKPLALGLLSQYKLSVPAPEMITVVNDSGTSEGIRVAALQLVSEQHASDKMVKDLLFKLLSGKTPSRLKVAALQELAKMDAKAAEPIAIELTEKGAPAEMQAAWTLLGGLGSEAADAALQKGLKSIATISPAARLDLLEACEARAAKISGMPEELAAASAGLHFNECLEGGNIALGKDIALNNVAANCVACHQFDKSGGSTVGPNLMSIATERDRAYLLDALIEPSKVVRAGYGLVTITPVTGDAIVGTLMKEDADKVQMKLPDGTVKEIRKTDIKEQSTPISIMPPMSVILTKRQTRDVVAYLASLKAAPKKETKEH